jgi:hypothetical protein
MWIGLLGNTYNWRRHGGMQDFDGDGNKHGLKKQQKLAIVFLKKKNQIPKNCKKILKN